MSANELICIPCRALGKADREYAVAFAVPVNAPGLTLVCHPLVDGPGAEAPVSGRNIEVETVTLFDNVSVPWERVFLCGEWQHAGAVARAFANYHRFTAVSYKPPLIDLMIGAAVLAADQLGLLRTTSVREKIGRLVIYGDLVRCARHAAAGRAKTGPTGLAYPDPVATNAGKFHFASGFHQAVATLQDITGGLVVTAPGIEDLDHMELGAAVERSLAGKAGVSGRQRWALAQLVRDLTASEWGGWNLVATMHGEGSLGAQLVETFRTASLESYRRFAEDVLS